jgi:hypothetical protein
MPESIEVFISYTHDSAQHKERVLRLAQRLRDDGLNCIIDRFVEGHPEEGWPVWMEQRIKSAHFVLIVCTAVYHLRFQGKEAPGKGLGSSWELLLARQELYAARGKNAKYIPVLFQGATTDDIPTILRDQYSHYSL